MSNERIPIVAMHLAGNVAPYVADVFSRVRENSSDGIATLIERAFEKAKDDLNVDLVRSIMLTFRTSAVGFPRISVRANFGGGLGCGNDAGGCGPIRRGRLTATAIPLISGRSPQPPHPAHATRLVLDSGGALDRQGDGPA